MKFLMVIVAILMVFMTAASALAVEEDFENLDPACWESRSSTGEGVAIYFGNVPIVTKRTEFVLKDTCAGDNEIDFIDEVDLVLGPIQEDEVIINEDSIYVDSVARPDLDAPAKIKFRNQPYAIQPDLEKDGSVCYAPDCNIESYSNGEFVANVSGFSNYTLQARQDFTVYSDEAPELQGKVYQVLDLGNAYRNIDFKCNVMIFAEDAAGELVLVQTNPERAVQARVLGNPDMNQPESLGYFPTENGVANVYFRNDLMVGYTEFQYVAQCQSNSTQLVYEETIVPVNSPLGRNFAAWGVWLTTDNGGQNAFFVVIYTILGLIAVSLILLFIRTVRRR